MSTARGVQTGGKGQFNPSTVGAGVKKGMTGAAFWIMKGAPINSGIATEEQVELDILLKAVPAKLTNCTTFRNKTRFSQNWLKQFLNTFHINRLNILPKFPYNFLFSGRKKKRNFINKCAGLNSYCSQSVILTSVPHFANDFTVTVTILCSMAVYCTQ